jgi:G3E family GTPase
MTSLDLHRAYSIDGVITLVDAVNGEGTYDIHEEAIKQTALADRIILSKCDIADALVIKSIISRISIINPKAMIIESNKKKIPVADLLGLNDYDPFNKTWDVKNWLAIEKYKDNRHNDNIESFALVTKQQVSMTTFNFFLELLTSQMGQDLLRIKGILNIRGESTPAIIHGVQHIFHPVEWLDKWPDNDRSTRLVFITRNIKKSAVEEFFNILGENELQTT